MKAAVLLSVLVLVMLSHLGTAFFQRHRVVAGLPSLPSFLSRAMTSSSSAAAAAVQQAPSSSSSSSNSSVPPLFEPVLVSIEGNIGAGKTTLLRELRQRHPEWVSIDEPVSTWDAIRNEEGESVLEVFYRDRRRWAYTFQNCALLTRYQNIERAVKEQRVAQRKSGKVIFLTERCLDTDYHVFTKMLQEDGSIDSLEINLYERLLKQLKKTATPLSAIVHINSPPLLCAERIKQRARSGEENITMDYLTSLDKYQVNWVNNTHIPTFVTHSGDLHGVEEFITNLAN